MSTLSQKATLTDRELALLTSEMPNRKKSGAVAWLLWIFLGFLGVYHFYLDNPRRGWFMVIFSIIGFATAIFFVGFAVIIGLVVLWIVDAVRMGGRLQAINAAIESQLIAEIIAGRTATPAPEPAT